MPDQLLWWTVGVGVHLVAVEPTMLSTRPARTRRLPILFLMLMLLAAPLCTATPAAAAPGPQPEIISPVPAKTVQVRTTAALNMRSGPGAEYRVILTIPQGTVITSTEQRSGWYKLTYSGKTGWSSGTYLTEIPSAGGRITTGYNHTHGGTKYHVYADGIDWTQPVGIMYYFDGDYWLPSYSQVEKPQGAVMTGMARTAARANLILVAPVTPAPYTAANGYTWWEKPGANAKWFRGFSDMIEKKVKPAPGKVWYMGYSGGAEFISYEIAARNQTSYKGGGAILLAGGGVPDTFKDTTREIKNGLPMHWFVGTKDRSGQTNPPTWSAYDEAAAGQVFYKKKKFRTTFTALQGLGHHDYSLPSIMDQGLKKKPPAPIPPPIDWVGFKDLPKTHAFVEEILWLKDTGITTGYEDGTFRMRNKISREAMAAFLYRYVGEEESDADAVEIFLDVPGGHLFAGEIAWLASNGITTGDEDGTFRPDDRITREAAAAFLYRLSR